MNNQEPSVIQKREKRFPSQFETCFRRFVNDDFKRRYTNCDFKEKEFQHRHSCQNEQFRNGRPTDRVKLGLQRHDHKGDPIDHSSMSAVNRHQSQCPRMTRAIQENNTLIDKPISVPGPSFKEFINNNHPVTTCDTNGSTSEATNSERSFFGEFETYLDSFNTKFAASSFEDKSRKQLNSFTPGVTMPSNVSLKGPPTVTGLSAFVYAQNTMRIDKNGTVQTEVISGTNETVIKSPAFGSDKVVGLPLVKDHLKPRKPTCDHKKMPNGVLKSILKRRPNSNYRCGKRKVTFAQGVLINSEGLVISDEHPIKSDDIMKETFNQCPKKRPRIELTRAQKSLSAIVKRLKMERMNRKHVGDVPRANRGPVLWGINLESKDARHKTAKSTPLLVIQKKSNTAILGYNDSLPENSTASSSKGVVGNRTTTISKSCLEPPPAKMVLHSKGIETLNCTVNSKEAEGNMPRFTRGSTLSSHVEAKNLASVQLFPCLCGEKYASFVKLKAHKHSCHVCRTSLTNADYSPDVPLRTMGVLENEFYEEKEEIKGDGSRCESLKADHPEHVTHGIHGKVNTCEYVVHNNRNDDEVVKEVSDVHNMKNDLCESRKYAREEISKPTINNCTKCNRKFKDIDNLLRHERAHSMEKLHACEFCKERFSLSSERNKHERTHGIEKTLCSCKE